MDLIHCPYGGIIVIDGPDGVGKATTTALVLELLQERKPLGGCLVLTESFPDYGSFFGTQVRNYLSGDDAEDQVRVPVEIRSDPRCASLPYAADRYWAFATKIWPQLNAGNWYVFDRYIVSNLAHQGAKIKNPAERDRFLEKLSLLEHGFFGLPTPNLTVILSLPETIRQQRVASRRVREVLETGEKPSTDIHEQDDRYMASVAVEYRRLASRHGWSTVELVANGRELSPDEVAEKVYDVIVTKLA